MTLNLKPSQLKYNKIKKRFVVEASTIGMSPGQPMPEEIAVGDRTFLFMQTEGDRFGEELYAWKYSEFRNESVSLIVLND